MQKQTTGQARTQDQNLLMLDHCQSSDLMRIVQFILLQRAKLQSANMCPSKIQNTNHNSNPTTVPQIAQRNHKSQISFVSMMLYTACNIRDLFLFNPYQRASNFMSFLGKHHRKQKVLARHIHQDHN